MKKELFDELMESIRQGGAIMRGEMKPSRVFKIDELDVKKHVFNTACRKTNSRTVELKGK